MIFGRRVYCDLNTVNIVLMVVLAAIIGFAIGNSYGQAKMKMIFNNLLDKLTKNMKAIVDPDTKGETK